VTLFQEIVISLLAIWAISFVIIAVSLATLMYVDESKYKG